VGVEELFRAKKELRVAVSKVGPLAVALPRALQGAIPGGPVARIMSDQDTGVTASDVLERQLTDTVTAGQLTTELIIRLDARVRELERITARMRDQLQALGVTVW